MNATELPMRGLGDARLAIHAAASQPAWLWSIDGTRVLWANPVGARLLGAKNSDLTAKVFGPADSHRRQVTQLAGKLRPDTPPRLERLRGFGAPLGRLVTCGCTRIVLADRSEAILIVAVEAIARAMPLSERLQRLVEDADIPLAAFGSDGMFVGASAAARALLGFRNLSEAGLDAARDDALKTGRTETPVGLGHLVLQRVGNGSDIGLIALLQPGAVPQPIASTTPEVVPAPASEALRAVEPARIMDEPEPESLTADADPVIEDALAANDEPPPFVRADDDSLEPFPDFEPSAPNAVEVDPAEHDVPLRTMPLRFVWEIDSREYFNVASDELLSLIGAQSAQTLNAPWRDVASAYGPFGRMASAIASGAAWSGISLALPADSTDEMLMADLSGIPTYQDGELSGYRGFGVIRDLDALTRLEALRERESRGPAPQSLSAHTPSQSVAMDLPDAPEHVEIQPTAASDTCLLNVDTPANVVHFRVSADGRAPVLSPVENNAFNELARELSARLEADHAAGLAADDSDAMSEFEEPASPAQPPAAADTGPRTLLDLAPVAMLVHRDGHIIYANAAFLTFSGHDTLATLQATAFDPTQIPHARRVALEWDAAPAEGLIVEPPPTDAPIDVPATVAGNHDTAGAEDLGAILDAADEAILMFDARGAIRACNRSAAKLFGADGDALIARDLAGLFTPDTQAAIAPLLERLADNSSEYTVEARTISNGVEIPLTLTIGRARPDGPNGYAIVRDLTPLKRGETELAQARRQTERASADKADILARISHEMRAPLSAIIGFADVMIEQRFGPLGSDRYADYLRDIRGCGERVVAIVDDLLDLSRIESGKRNLALTPQDLNDLVEQCVAAMQPQANRERIIIRSSLAHPLPHIVADGASLRQIALNLIGNSIHLANPGGQVIVSTVYADSGDVLLRVRDTGHGLNDNEVATALAPFRPSSEDGDAPALIRLSLTRALAEANHARFSVKPAPYAGTLIEVAFSSGRARV
jgi:PAS domain S-box-containing protein